MKLKISGYALDLTERVASTFAAAFLSYLGAHFSNDAFKHIALWEGAAGAGGAAAISLLKGLLAKKVGNSQSASILPAALGGAAGAAVGGAVGTVVGDTVGGVGQAVNDVLKPLEGK
jgi:hypothetical protein